MDKTSAQKRIVRTRRPLADDDPLWQHALQVFETDSRTVRWFGTRHVQLGMSPAEALATAGGRAQIEVILTSIEHGLPV